MTEACSNVQKRNNVQKNSTYAKHKLPDFLLLSKGAEKWKNKEENKEKLQVVSSMDQVPSLELRDVFSVLCSVMSDSLWPHGL